MLAQFFFSLFLFILVQGLPTPFEPLPTSANCTAHKIMQDVDHFSYGDGHQFSQRYFVCDKFSVHGGPVFFYTGNEADVTLFVNNTGFMWELGQSMGALLVFAEHRGYGESITAIRSVSQVLSDYAHLIVHLYDQFQTSAINSRYNLRFFIRRNAKRMDANEVPSSRRRSSGL